MKKILGDPETSHDETLREAFGELKRTWPSMPEKTKPLSHGFHGLTTDNGDGTITKAFFHHKNHPDKTSAWFENEAMALRLLDGRRFDRVATPRLVEEPAYFINEEARPRFYGLLRMTKLEGKPTDWYTFQNTATQKELRHYFHQVGRLAARFHASAFPTNETRLQESTYYQSIVIPENIPDEIKQKLRVAGEYFDTHKEASVIHGDIAGRNILSQDNRLTGLVDFGMCRRDKNFLNDFVCMLWNDEMTEETIQGYERESGKPIDRVMVSLSNICTNASWLVELEKKGDQYDMTGNIKKSLVNHLDSLPRLGR